MKPRATRIGKRSIPVVFGLVAVTLAPLAAGAHPSDFQTLTIDLLFGVIGLEAIDAAVVESSGPTYEPFPSVELRQQVAKDVLAALDLAEWPASINAELSERYHEVGFFVTLDESQPDGEGFTVDTAPLQGIAEDLNLERLKLSVCSETSETFSKLEIDATIDGRPPIRSNRNERHSCQVWELPVDDPPVTITVTAFALPMTGLSTIAASILALTLLITGAAIMKSQQASKAALSIIRQVSEIGRS